MFNIILCVSLLFIHLNFTALLETENPRENTPLNIGLGNEELQKFDKSDNVQLPTAKQWRQKYRSVFRTIKEDYLDKDKRALKFRSQKKCLSTTCIKYYQHTVRAVQAQYFMCVDPLIAMFNTICIYGVANNVPIKVCFPLLGNGYLRAVFPKKNCPITPHNIVPHPLRNMTRHYILCLNDTLYLFKCNGYEIFDKHLSVCRKRKVAVTVTQDDTNGHLENVNCEEPETQSFVYNTQTCFKICQLTKLPESSSYDLHFLLTIVCLPGGNIATSAPVSDATIQYSPTDSAKDYSTKQTTTHSVSTNSSKVSKTSTTKKITVTETGSTTEYSKASIAGDFVRTQTTTKNPTSSAIDTSRIENIQLAMDDVNVTRPDHCKRIFRAFPDETCMTRGVFRYKNSCKNAYTCVWDAVCKQFQQFHYNCPLCLQFNPITRKCDWPENIPECRPDDGTRSRICTGRGKFPIPNSKHCNRYYDCQPRDDGNYGLIVRTCGKNRSFHSHSQNCVENYSGCKEELPPVCEFGNETFTRDHTCKTYYHCGINKELYKFRCNDGLYFGGEFCEPPEDLLENSVY